MIEYTQFTASQEVPPPYHFPGATVYAFVWDAHLEAVQTYCDHTFNLGEDEERPFTYRPASFWPYAILLLIDYPQMIAAPAAKGMGGETPYQDRGVISQREAFVALPVVRYGATPETRLFQSALEWAIPFIAVGNPMSASCGREMLGLPKLLADITMDTGVYPGSFSGHVKLPGWRKVEPGARQEMLPFLDVETAPVLPTYRGRDMKTRATAGRDSLWSLFQSREAGWAFDSLVSAANLADDLTVGLAPTVMRTVSLRQIRDARNTGKALYQALVSCRSHYDNVREFSFFNEKDVTITFHDEGSFRGVLGVLLGPRNSATKAFAEIRPRAAFRFTADIDFDQLRTIYTFTGNDDLALREKRAKDLTAPWLRPWRTFFGVTP